MINKIYAIGRVRRGVARSIRNGFNQAALLPSWTGELRTRQNGNLRFVNVLSNRQLGAALGLACLLGAVTSQVGSRVAQRLGLATPPKPYAATREKVILSQAMQGRFPVVIVGDSFVELADIPTVCGKRALNAGISGARAADVALLIPNLIKVAKPDWVVVEVGVNDAHKRHLTPTTEFRKQLEKTIATIRKSGANVILLDIAPLSGEALSSNFDASHAEALNDVVQNLGGKSVSRLASDDGLHPNSTGYREWKATLEKSCG